MPENKKFFPLLLVFVIFFAADARAQMFSVGSEPGRIDVPSTAIYLGLEPADFEYQGGVLGLPGSEGRFEFSGSLLRLRLETPALQFFLATGGSLTGIDDVSYFDAGVQAGYSFSIVRQKQLTVRIPFQLLSSLTSVNTDESIPNAPQFRQGALAAGLGGFIGVRPSERVRVQASFVPHYGFSFATGGTFGGSLAKLDGRLRLFLDRVFGDTGLSLGYNYKFNRFDVDENEFDYDLRSHSILVGITF
ncbi:MAG: hypothetical protein R3281_17580 [Balneolaceae bacterium]|nr:hypothetical protein [Balneolaceae bacterium]